MIKSKHSIIFLSALIAILSITIPLSSESFAKPDKCETWPDCPGQGGSGGKTPFDFILALSENSKTIEAGNSFDVNVTISDPSGSGNVNLSASNIPTGVTVSFNPTSGKISPNNSPFNSTMTIDVSSDGISGTIDINASVKSTTKTSAFVLSVADTTPPETTITSKPSDPSSDDTPAFTFSANEPATFECSLDSGSFSPCYSGDSFGPLSDGVHTFDVAATDSANNTDPTPASYSWTIDTNTADPVIVAVGDIACNTSSYTSTTCRHAQTAERMITINPDAVITLGDNQYQNGELSNFQTYYHPTWGQAFDKTYPAPGNHEYGTPNAAGYFDYFGTRAGNTSNGYYSFDIGSWHVVSLNSNCVTFNDDSCSNGSPQADWLQNDLETHNNGCTLVYWHHPRYSAGTHGDNSRMDYFWQLLDANNVDVALAGHDHNYQRFAPMDSTGSYDPNGIREFVVGTGGKSHYSLNTSDNNLESYKTSTFGVLKMTLHDTSYDWEFVGETGDVFDSGSWNCNIN